jgi:hypothetical protein
MLASLSRRAVEGIAPLETRPEAPAKAPQTATYTGAVGYVQLSTSSLVSKRLPSIMPSVAGVIGGGMGCRCAGGTFESVGEAALVAA